MSKQTWHAGDFMFAREVSALDHTLAQARRWAERAGERGTTAAIRQAEKDLRALRDGLPPEGRRARSYADIGANTSDVLKVRAALQREIQRLQAKAARQPKSIQMVAPWMAGGRQGYSITPEGRCRAPSGAFATRQACGLSPADPRGGCRDAAGNFVPAGGCLGAFEGTDSTLHTAHITTSVPARGTTSGVPMARVTVVGVPRTTAQLVAIAATLQQEAEAAWAAIGRPRYNDYAIINFDPGAKWPRGPMYVGADGAVQIDTNVGLSGTKMPPDQTSASALRRAFTSNILKSAGVEAGGKLIGLGIFALAAKVWTDHRKKE